MSMLLNLDYDKERQDRKLVTVVGRITEMDPRRQDQRGVPHQIFTMEIRQVLDNRMRTDAADGQLVTAAIRYGDAESIPEPIPGLKAGQPIALRGVYIARQDARDTDGDGVRLAVIHFTHRPLGWVLYQGRRYE